ncbi:MAG: hypothetical protein ACTSXC_08210 [Candidatus Freyarchaeota archaeon]
MIKYVFNPYFLWILTFNSYDGKWYSIFINQYVLFQREFALKAVIFATVLGVAAIVSIKCSQVLTPALLKKPQDELESEQIVKDWKTNKRITSVVLILQYLTLIALVALTFLVWFDMFQQHTLTFHNLARYAIVIISVLGVLYLIHPTLDDEEILAQACLGMISSVKKGYKKENVEKVELVHFMLYILLNHALSKNIKELEEVNLEPLLTTLYFALLQNDEETLTRAKNITTSLIKSIAQQKIRDILKHLSEAEKKLGDIQDMTKTMEISMYYPNPTLYTFTPSKWLTRIKAIIPIVTQVVLATIIFFAKWIYYSSF